MENKVAKYLTDIANRYYLELSSKLRTIIEKIINKGYQIEEDAYKILESMDKNESIKIIDDLLEQINEIDPKPVFITKEMIKLKNSNLIPSSISTPTITKKPLAAEYDQKVEVLYDSTNLVGSGGDLEDFKRHFRSRLEKITRILKERIDVKNVRPLSESFKASKDKTVKSIVIVSDKRERPERIILTVEDFDTEAKVLITSKDRSLYRKAQMISLDQVLCLEIISGRRDLLIAKDIIFPGIPERTIIKTNNDLSLLLLSDIHLGSKTFLYKEFRKLISWLNGEIGNSNQKEKAGLIKFVIITGDLVDGIGIYPGQEDELSITNIYKQYLEISKYIQEIPDYINIIVIPGNHDAVRQALPQPAITKDFAEPIYEFSNLISLGNPSWIKIGGRTLLLYHGTGLNSIISSIPGLSLNNPERALSYIMDVRHLAPSFGVSTPIAPEPEDSLVVEYVPDIVQSGHIHVSGYENYRGTLLISCAAWQSQTEYQRRMGVVPTIGKAVTVNLGSLDLGIIDFTSNK